MAECNDLPSIGATLVAQAILSAFERLPTELRTLIYEHLGFPRASKKIELHYPHEWRPGYKHHGSKNQAVCEGWRSGPFRLNGVRFHDALGQTSTPIGTVLSTRKPLELPEVCGNLGCRRRALRMKRWIILSTNMMCVSRRIHAELCDMLYSGMSIRFDIELSERAVHVQKLIKWPDWRAPHRYSMFTRMAMSEATMSHLTLITLSELVGVHNTAVTPKFSKAFCQRVLKRQARSLEYLAEHCPKLQVLTYSPHARVIRKCKRHQLDDFASTLAKAVGNCKELRRLEIEAFQHETSDRCYENAYRQSKEGHAASKEARVRETLTWERGNGLEPADIAVWAMAILVNVRKNKALIMSCPGKKETVDQGL